MRNLLRVLAALATLAGCENFGVGPVEAPLIGSDIVRHDTGPEPEPEPDPIDQDGDGVKSDVDCDDTDALQLLPVVWYEDNDEDGLGGKITSQACFQPDGHVAETGDCDDNDAKILPGQPEICNSEDDDCNGVTDDSVSKQWYHDADGDGHGDPTQPFKDGCDGASFLSSVGDDCNDHSAEIYPGATETCNGVDDDCNSEIDDEVADAPTWYKDADGDGFGRDLIFVSIQACVQPQGYADQIGDCADENEFVHPGVDESCNDIDDNCVGGIDEGVLTTFYADEDKDGYGNAAITQQSCKPVGKYIADSTDCDDKNAAAHPNGLEVCDGADNDCNGGTDEGLIQAFFPDEDGDLYGDASVAPIYACSAPVGKYIAKGFDCDDTNASIYPFAPEECNGKDENCNGQIDEAEPDVNLCEDGDAFTIDTCNSLEAGCVYEEIVFAFTCELPEEFPGAEGFQCGVGVFFDDFADPDGYGDVIMLESGVLEVHASTVCAQLQAGHSMYVNSYVFDELGGDLAYEWVGGSYVVVADSVNGDELDGTPGNVTIVAPGLDFVYDLADALLCQ
ncbi:MAG: putative metal-binding motif-containing protein [Planctomycetota bacterium]